MVSPENIPLKLSDFDENELESIERQNLQAKLFTNTMQKLATSSTASEGQSVSDVRTFLDCDASHLHMDQPSRVHYLELVDENPHSDETMSLIAEDLLEKFDNVQSGQVVLVGDGKTYQHLMRQYGRALNKLLIFPGDWHTLQNFQSVLMKIYYKAGLMELAECSDYRGATLKSPGQCSNFKRTHQFILQVWEALYREMLHAYLLKNENMKIFYEVKCLNSCNGTKTLTVTEHGENISTLTRF